MWPEQRETTADKQEQGPRQFFEARLEPLMDRLYGTALRLCRDPDEAEDVVAETVARAWLHLSELKDRRCFEGWLFRILNHTFISLRRRKRCRQDREVPWEHEGDDEGSFSLFEKLHQPFLLWWGTPERDFINRLLQEDLQRALDQLPDPYRIVMVMVEIEGFRYDEVAHALDLPLGTVQSRLSRARSLLQKTLWQQGQDAGLVRDTRHKRRGGGS